MASKKCVRCRKYKIKKNGFCFRCLKELDKENFGINKWVDLKIKAKCSVCGDVFVGFFQSNDNRLSVPVELCPTIEDLANFYKEFKGSSYEETTGNPIEKSFIKRFITPYHLSLDDVGLEELEKHILEPIECWDEVL